MLEVNYKKETNEVLWFNGGTSPRIYVDESEYSFVDGEKNWYMVENNHLVCYHRPYTEEERKEYDIDGTRKAKLKRIKELKQLLADSDYKAIKFAEGLITEEEYASIRTLRQSWRDEINQLEEELG